MPRPELRRSFCPCERQPPGQIGTAKVSPAAGFGQISSALRLPDHVRPIQNRPGKGQVPFSSRAP